MKPYSLISIAIACVLFSCGRLPDDSARVVRVWAAMEKEEITALITIADRFRERTGITVQITEIGLFEITTKLELAAPAGKGPDLVSVSHTSTGTLSLMGLLSPVDFLDHYLAACPQSFVDAFRYRGELVGIPLTVESYGLVINKDLIREAPKTWEDLFTRAGGLTKDTDGDGKIDTYGFLTDPTNFYFTFPFYDAGGCYIFKKSASGITDTTDLGFCRPGGIRGLAMMTDLVGRYRLVPAGVTYPVITDLFARKRVAMTIYGTYLIPEWERQGIHVGYTKLPPFADGSRGRPLATLMGMGISAWGDNKKEAEQFLAFLLSPENLRLFFTLSGGTKVMADPEIYRDEDFTRVPYLSTAVSIAADAYPYPNDPEGDLVWDAVRDAATLAVNGSLPPEQALCDMQRRLGAVIKEMRQ